MNNRKSILGYPHDLSDKSPIFAPQISTSIIPKSNPPRNHEVPRLVPQSRDTVVDSSSIFSGAAGSMAKTGFVAAGFEVSCGTHARGTLGQDRLG